MKHNLFYEYGMIFHVGCLVPGSSILVILSPATSLSFLFFFFGPSAVNLPQKPLPRKDPPSIQFFEAFYYFFFSIRSTIKPLGNFAGFFFFPSRVLLKLVFALFSGISFLFPTSAPTPPINNRQFSGGLQHPHHAPPSFHHNTQPPVP